MYRNEDYISTGYNYLFLGIWNLSILFSDICSGTVDIHSIITTELVCAVTIGGDTHGYVVFLGATFSLIPDPQSGNKTTHS